MLCVRRLTLSAGITGHTADLYCVMLKHSRANFLEVHTSLPF
jgi:hypothetical protein